MIADDEARAVVLDRLQGISTSAGNAKISAGISQTGDFHG
jgi:hypothetical protein